MFLKGRCHGQADALIHARLCRQVFIGARVDSAAVVFFLWKRLRALLCSNQASGLPSFMNPVTRSHTAAHATPLGNPHTPDELFAAYFARELGIHAPIFHPLAVRERAAVMRRLLSARFTNAE